jgi:NADH dehydrogenase
MTAGMLLGLLAWIGFSLTLEPIVDGEGLAWTAGAAGQRFPYLVGGVLWGGAAGLGLWLVRRLLAGTAKGAATTPSVAEVVRVVILGGGFGGVSTARQLEQLLGRQPGLEVTVVSASNYLLFTPMLAEVAARSLEPTHISAPVRVACPRTRFRWANVESVDAEARTVRVLLNGSGLPEVLPYDHLVLALGGVPDYLGLPGVAEHSFALKTLEDANRLRNHVVNLLEQADAETDPAERGRKLTFVVAGGGFAGTELCAALHDMVLDVLPFFPSIAPDDVRAVLVHSRPRILPELGPELAETALRTLRHRGIQVELGVRVAGASEDGVGLADGRFLPTRTLVWTAGNQPNPILARLPFELGRRGAVLTASTLQVRGHRNVWAIGDCAEVPDPHAGGQPFPPTAQHAMREGKWVAKNLVLALSGSYPKPFRFRTIGFMVSLGRRTAAAELRGQRFSGLLAWLMWRAVYLGKLPGLEKQLRVLIDWVIDLFFPRDIALTTSATEQGRNRRARARRAA